MMTPRQLPKIRRGLLVRRIGDETVVYDRESHRAHSLSREAGIVFHGCGGRDSPDAIAESLRRECEMSGPDAASVFEAALSQIAGAGLFEGAPDREPHAESEPSRRAVLSTLAVVSAAPMVLSILVPTPAQAQTCIPRKRPCSSSTECCPDAPCCRQRGTGPPECSRGGGACIP